MGFALWGKRQVLYVKVVDVGRKNVVHSSAFNERFDARPITVAAEDIDLHAKEIFCFADWAMRKSAGWAARGFEFSFSAHVTSFV